MKQQLQSSAGFALLLMIVVLIGVASIGLSSILTNSVKHSNEQRSAENRKILLEAKEVLLSYAVDYALTADFGDIGELPCPDAAPNLPPLLPVNAREGVPDNVCSLQGANTIGYFPFKRLDKGKFEDSVGECLWYVVSGAYKNSPDDLRNWDSLGYLNLVDESGNLLHAVTEDDYPIAFIISPGASLSQNRAPNAALPGCNSNYNIAAYLEGGPNINYAVDLPNTADTLWSILTTSQASKLDNVNYNDQVVAIYKSEWWDRVKSLGSLSFNNAQGAIATTPLELLTQSLAECIAAYGNNAANLAGQLPYPAPIDLVVGNNDQNEYRSKANYDDSNIIWHGRFPQVLDNSIWNVANFVFDSTAAQSYCEAAGVTPYDGDFWNHWKDHFFYIVSDDFDSAAGPTPRDNTKCIVNNCITVNGGADKVAAMVLFAGEAQLGQNRTWWWDDPNALASIDSKSLISNYMEGGNQTVYAAAPQDYAISNPANGEFDYQYCVEYVSNGAAIPSYQFVALKCSDLDGVNDAP